MLELQNLVICFSVLVFHLFAHKLQAAVLSPGLVLNVLDFAIYLVQLRRL